MLFVLLSGGIYLYSENSKLFSHAIQMITVISTVTIMFSFMINSYAQYKIEAHDSTIGYKSNLHLFLNDIIQLFINKPHMTYMYSEMMGIKPKKNIVRHTDEEIMIGCYIFANCAKVAAYIYLSHKKTDANIINNWLTKVLTQYLKSPILLNVWKTEYKPKLAGPLLIRYMDTTFSL